MTDNVPPIELLKKAKAELFEAADKFWVMHCDLPAGDYKDYTAKWSERASKMSYEILDALKAMGEPLTEPKGEEAKRNECDCLRRPDSEGMPAGLKPASPANVASSEISDNQAEFEAWFLAENEHYVSGYGRSVIFEKLVAQLGYRCREVDTAYRAWCGARLKPVSINPDMPAQDMRLHMGEMTAQEMRTARAAIRWANSVMGGATPELADARVEASEARGSVARAMDDVTPPATVQPDELTEFTLRGRFEEILSPAVNTKAPYAKFMIDALIQAAREALCRN